VVWLECNDKPALVVLRPLSLQPLAFLRASMPMRLLVLHHLSGHSQSPVVHLINAGEQLSLGVSCNLDILPRRGFEDQNGKT
jgi:hypothetical protein